ncbi:MAG: quinolinate synthase NadA [bacterium]
MTGDAAPRLQEQTEELQHRIRQLASEKSAVILAHNYQVGPVQDVADHLGDSLGLSRRAAEVDAERIVFCGVHFMAETAAILSPDKMVLVPDLEAGCSLAATIDAEALTEWRADHPEAVVVSYVNTTAEVKALSDYCCTSSNAVEVVNSIPEDTEILFLPDMFLGSYVAEVTGRKNMRIWPGECHVHAAIPPHLIKQLAADHPEADLLVHPECGCSTSCMYLSASGELDLGERDLKVMSTGGMILHADQSPAPEFVVATETGILHRLRKENPRKRFIPASEDSVCEYMKKITLEKVLFSLEHDVYRVEVDEETASAARKALDRMLAIG